MKRRELINMGLLAGSAIDLALQTCGDAAGAGQRGEEIRQTMKSLLGDPAAFAADPIYGPLATALISHESTSTSIPYVLRDDLTYAVWGDDIDPEAHKQTRSRARSALASSTR